MEPIFDVELEPEDEIIDTTTTPSFHDLVPGVTRPLVSVRGGQAFQFYASKTTVSSPLVSAGRASLTKLVNYTTSIYAFIALQLLLLYQALLKSFNIRIKR